MIEKPVEGVLGAGESAIIIESSTAQVVVGSYFSEMPAYGVHPLWVEIENRTDREAVWEWESLSGSIHGGAGEGLDESVLRQELRVPSRSRMVFELLCPVKPLPWQIALKAELKGSSGERVELTDMRDSSPAMSMLVTPEVASLVRSTISIMKGQVNLSLMDTTVDPARMPTDWRAYSGVQSLWLMRDEWEGLRSEVRQAILTWVRLGGHVRTIDDGGSQSIEEALQADLERVGLGTYGSLSAGQDAWSQELTLLFPDGDWSNPYPLPGFTQRGSRVDGDTPLPASLRDWFYPRPMTHLQAHFGPISQYMPSLMNAIEMPSISPQVLAVVIGLFFIVVGPLNPWGLKAGRRLNLLVMIPVISVVTTLLLGVYLVLGEGLGGQGVRLRLEYYSEDARQMASTEFRYAETALLLQESYQREEGSLHIPVVDSGYADVWQESEQFIDDKGTMRGDWYRDRWEQAEIIMQAEPGRSPAVLSGDPDGRPAVTWEAPISAEWVYYLDPVGQWWKTGALRPGERSVFTRTGERDLLDALRTPGNEYPKYMREEILRLTYQRNHFFALTYEPADENAPEFIDWIETRVFLSGDLRQRIGGER